MEGQRGVIFVSVWTTIAAEKCVSPPGERSKPVCAPDPDITVKECSGEQVTTGRERRHIWRESEGKVKAPEPNHSGARTDDGGREQL